jgi:septal ring factor EnvC (AmiA/AmiB activator)
MENQQLQARLESTQTELQILERKFEDERITQLKLHDEIQSYKEALVDLKSELCTSEMFVNNTTCAEPIIDDSVSGIQL